MSSSFAICNLWCSKEKERRRETGEMKEEDHQHHCCEKEDCSGGCDKNLDHEEDHEEEHDEMYQCTVCDRTYVFFFFVNARKPDF